MEVSCQLNAPTALFLWEDPPVSIAYIAGWPYVLRKIQIRFPERNTMQFLGRATCILCTVPATPVRLRSHVTFT